MNLVVALVGMTGAGKSIVSDAFVEKGYQYVRFGQITLDMIKQEGLDPTEENERVIREAIRKEHGMGAYATLNIPKIDSFLEQHRDVVIDGLYSWTEYKILKEYYKHALVVVAVYAPPAIRYQRLVQRVVVDVNMRNRPATFDQARSRDYAEIENIEKAGPIAMADYTIINDGSLKELNKKIEQVIGLIENNNRI